MASPRTTEPLIMGTVGSVPTSHPDCEVIREHLEHVLASPGFRNSKRVSGLLRYVVEHSLGCSPERLKERTIGVEVFGRSPDYDTNVDHSVRSAAGEVRKRLAQYYMENQGASAIRIELQAGSYVPQFHRPSERVWAEVVPLDRVPTPVTEPHPQSYAARWRIPLLSAAGFLALVMIATAVILSPPASAFDRFWAPILSSSRSALFCVGGGRVNPADSARPLTVTEFEHLPNRRMHTSDATAMALMMGVLEAHHKPYRLLNRASATSFQELQQGPVVLIGAMNNAWTLRLTAGTRFHFDRDANGIRITDKENPSAAWSVNPEGNLADFNRDYGIVSRLRDPKTGQSVIIVGGLLSWGTLAAGQFASDPDHLRKLDAFGPKGWEKKNVQVLIATEVINGSSGPPQILATHFW